MISRCLLFDTTISGHRIEYLHHIYMEMITRKGSFYVIVVPEKFKDVKNVYEWPVSINVSFDFIPSSLVKNLENRNLLLSAFKKTRVLREYVKKHQSDKLFLIDLMPYIPFLPLFINRSTRVYGIIYRIYLYDWNSSSWCGKLVENIKYRLISGKNCIQKVFILNDAMSARMLNKLYDTDKFDFLSDPFNDTGYIPSDLRCKLGILDSQKVFLHFGGLSRRKGTLEILKAMTLLTDHERTDTFFIFAGKVYSDIHEEFYRMVEMLKSECNIKVFDEFCRIELVADFCCTCDAILIPYSNTSQSSGILGYAAFYGKPVISPSQGLLGKIVKKYHLGICLNEVTPRSIATAVANFIPYHSESYYRQMIKKETFVSQIIDFL